MVAQPTSYYFLLKPNVRLYFQRWGSLYVRDFCAEYYVLMAEWACAHSKRLSAFLYLRHRQRWLWFRKRGGRVVKLEPELMPELADTAHECGAVPPLPLRAFAQTGACPCSPSPPLSLPPPPLSPRLTAKIFRGPPS